MNVITFRFLISLVVFEKLDLKLTDVVTAYLYGESDTDIYLKIPNGYKLHEAKSKSIYPSKLKRSLYGLRQF